MDSLDFLLPAKITTLAFLTLIVTFYFSPYQELMDSSLTSVATYDFYY
jgi:hypothetical protein